MLLTERIILYIFCIYSLVCIIFGYKNAVQKKNSFGYSDAFIPLGAWVWGDALIFGAFWFLVSLFILFKNDWLLFLLITSVFWMVRSFGEIIYWLNQQFSTLNKNPPKKMRFYNLIKNDSIWFIYQIFWQCVLVITIITSAFLIKVWLAR